MLVQPGLPWEGGVGGGVGGGLVTFEVQVVETVSALSMLRSVKKSSRKPWQAWVHKSVVNCHVIQVVQHSLVVCLQDKGGAVTGGCKLARVGLHRPTAALECSTAAADSAKHGLRGGAASRHLAQGQT